MQFEEKMLYAVDPKKQSLARHQWICVPFVDAFSAGKEWSQRNSVAHVSSPEDFFNGRMDLVGIGPLCNSDLDFEPPTPAVGDVGCEQNPCDGTPALPVTQNSLCTLL